MTFMPFFKVLTWGPGAEAAPAGGEAEARIGIARPSTNRTKDAIGRALRGVKRSPRWNSTGVETPSRDSTRRTQPRHAMFRRGGTARAVCETKEMGRGVVWIPAA